MIYTCGTELNKNDCGCYISVQLGCDSVINQNYYKFELGEIVCHKCGAELDQGDKEKYREECPSFTSIKPSCDQCGKWIYGKDKKPSCAAKTGGAKKRKSSGKPVKPSKKPKNAKKSAKKRKATPKPKNKPAKKSKKPTVVY